MKLYSVVMSSEMQRSRTDAEPQDSMQVQQGCPSDDEGYFIAYASQPSRWGHGVVSEAGFLG